MFKTILVHLSGTQTDDATLSTAYQIARLFDGHMVCLRVRPDTSAMLGQAAGAAMAPSVAVAEMLEMLRRKDAEQTEKALRWSLATVCITASGSKGASKARLNKGECMGMSCGTSRRWSKRWRPTGTFKAASPQS